MKYSDISEMKLSDVLGMKVMFLDKSTGRYKVGRVKRISHKELFVYYKDGILFACPYANVRRFNKAGKVVAYIGEQLSSAERRCRPGNDIEGTTKRQGMWCMCQISGNMGPRVQIHPPITKTDKK